MRKKIVVTGGCGFIGSYVSKNLHEKGSDIAIYDDLSNASGATNLPKKIKIIKKSILDIDSLRRAFRNANTVFHMAVKPLPMSFNDPDEIVRVNDFGSYLVSKVCTEFKCKLIHVSSSEAYGSAKYIPMKESHPFLPSTIYASSKAASELYVKGFEKTDGLKAVIVRPFNSYGPFMRDDVYAAALPKFFTRIKNGKPPIIYGDGNQTRDFSFVEDTANGIILANEEKNAIGDVFNIGQGKELSIKKMAKIMIREYSSITGKKLDLKLEFQKERKGDVKRHLADISHARKVLGYKPKVSFEEGIRRYLDWKIKTKN